MDLLKNTEQAKLSCLKKNYEICQIFIRELYYISAKTYWVCRYTYWCKGVDIMPWYEELYMPVYSDAAKGLIGLKLSEKRSCPIFMNRHRVGIV